ncbi:MAG: UDP-N-acetylmuramoyl-tripeptide--D-alanyl-D-alanine ligase, partial [Candidatus Omnitrophota bacterium]|nr:UDP-N-acetylmuramoyl-tripeptide--D-alanyl-D-alanine ligase [Candidatus Omnitrophota bacterium]
MFSVNEIVEATGGKLIQGNLRNKLAGISTDSRKLNNQDAFLALRGNNFDGHDFIFPALKSGAACVIAEKTSGLTIPKGLALIQVKNTTLALGDIARFQRQKFNLPVIAVTGSNGKTTVKEMIAWILSGDARVLKNEGTKNNQIGLPQTLIRLKKSDDFAVVEIGTNHFGEVVTLAKIALANIGIITNIGQSHLEFLKDLKGVLKEKSALLNNLAKPALAILNADDKLLKGIISQEKGPAQVFSYGIKEKSDFRASAIKLGDNEVKFKVNRKFDFVLSTPGDYNIYNALAAIAVGRIFGLDYRKIASRLAGFKFPNGRLNLVEFRGVRFIDDTYNSNPLSLSCALKVLSAMKCKGRKILVMGDMLELGRQKESLHRQAAGSITDTCGLLVTVGSLAKLTAKAACAGGLKSKNIFSCASALEARDLLFKKIIPGADDVVLVKGSRSMKMEEVFSAFALKRFGGSAEALKREGG